MTIIPRQDEIQVFINEGGFIVIKRVTESDSEYPMFTAIEPEHAEVVANAILAAAAEYRSGPPTISCTPERVPES